MPEWLKILLAANSSLGLVDTLQTLTGVTPSYERMTSNRLAGSVYPGAAGLTLGMSPKTIEDFSKSIPSKGSSLGDFVIGHEFGHIAGSGMGNPALGDAFLKLDKSAWKSEDFANEFASAVQFLRDGSTELGKLKPKTRKVVDILLTQDIYKQHPLNRGKDFSAVLPQLIKTP